MRLLRQRDDDLRGSSWRGLLLQPRRRFAMALHLTFAAAASNRRSKGIIIAATAYTARCDRGHGSAVAKLQLYYRATNCLRASAGLIATMVGSLPYKDIKESQMSSSAHGVEVAMSRVLVGLDFSKASEKALRHAIAISRSYGAKFYFAHVISSLGFVMAGPDATAMAAEANSRDIHKLETYLLQTGALTGISYETVICQGEIWQELERVIEDQHVDLIVVGTHGRTGLRKIALGSVAEAVFRHASCPVLTVGPHVPEDAPPNARLRHILYPTDLSPESAQAAGYAASLARQHEARLTVVHVVERREGAKTDEQERDFEARFRKQLPGDLPHNWTFRTQLGPIDQTILELAAEGRVGLIVLGLRSSHSFVHPHGWPHAYKVACEACCPVLTVRCGTELKS
jgi:nucleotide-binding universal stress UspA family protein